MFGWPRRPAGDAVDERSAKRLKLQYSSALAAPASYAQTPASLPPFGSFDPRSGFGGAAPPRKPLAHSPRRSSPPLRRLLLQQGAGLGFGGSRLAVPRTQPAPAPSPAPLSDFSHFRRLRPDAAPFAFTPLAAALPVDAEAFATPSALTQALHGKRLEATQRAQEADAGASIRAFEARATQVASEDLTAGSRLSEISTLNQKLERLALSRPTLAAPAEADTLRTPLTEEQEELVRDALSSNGRRTDILVASSFKTMGELELSRKHLECMHEGVWLNDEVINFYLGLLQEREKLAAKGGQPRVHFHNTFFYKKLFSGSQSYDFKSVQRWTTEKRLAYSIMDCELVVVPVHQELHWVLAVISLKERHVKYLDSLKGVDRDCLRWLVQYICDEAKAKKNEAWDPSDWGVSAPRDIPAQLNGCDCGVFMVKYADAVARGMAFSGGGPFTQADMPYFRRRIVAECMQKKAS